MSTGIVVLYFLIIVCSIELSNLCVYGFKVITKNMVDELTKEIEYGNVSGRMIHCGKVSRLRFDYIATTITSFITPYYVSCDNYSQKYRVLRFTKPYYIIKKEMKKV